MAKHLSISGKVQGVGYRAAFAAQASTLQLRGWVRNRRDGSVEALVAGDATALEGLLAWAWQGPPSARVSQVTVMDADDNMVSASTFEIHPTA